MVAAADNLAASAGVAALQAGGTAVDAAVAAGAVLAVTNQHQCGLGGDLFALVHRPGQPVAALCRRSRRLGRRRCGPRREGLDRLPLRGDVRAVTVPGCVDGWIELHGRFGRLPLARVLEPATAYADRGFPASRLLAYSATEILALDGADDYRAATTDGAAGAGGTGAPTGRGGDAGRDRARGPRALLPRAVR